MLIALVCLMNSALAGGLKLQDTLQVKIQKPEVSIVMNKQHLTPKYDLELTQSFLPKVVESVAEKPF